MSSADPRPGREPGCLPMYPGPLRYVAGLPQAALAQSGPVQPGRCLVMGVVNVTPDSFSDGGMWLETNSAIRHGREMVGAGADLIDVGGESTRPGAQRTSISEELDRVLPVVSALSADGAVVSVDTMRAEVARRAVEAGAIVVNDVSGGLADETMLGLVADLGVPYIVMHWRGHSTSMQEMAVYDDVVSDVMGELRLRIEAALAAGVSPDRLAIDPGIGFAKKAHHNWALLRNLHLLHELGFPLVVGSSRKMFLGALLADSDGKVRPPFGRDDASAALSTLAALSGAWCVRVHDAQRSADAVRVAARIAAEPPR